MMVTEPKHVGAFLILSKTHVHQLVNKILWYL